MASVLPRKPLEKVEFCEVHNEPWAANSVAIGTTTTAVTDLATKTTAARDAYNAQQAAQNAAKAATNTYRLAVEAMVDAASDIIKQIKVKAATAGDSVYSLAEIPSPSLPTPIAPPGLPDNFTATLDRTGVLQLAWKCVNPPGSTGTIYEVGRQIGADGEWLMIGATGRREFDDPSVPAGTALVTYRVKGLRSTVAGPVNEFTVKFGASAGGGMTASVVTAAAPKLAA